ncbi:putative protein [Mycolicibacterium vanbaalenii]|uniref:Transmembrane protein n=1 Tax=Mycolicibacterium vanbaalenii TaxID=110539 RepID=A0A5S9R752_MYCVN|nr:DUF2567 domain-containing protein [Mycolicibacterium vanbaalenii]CAA0092244.1 putative protein [Mycolicibacterium vanbaalenii]CAA0133995.1 putative protein [Mycolicibacterium vanbaalenii]
MTVPPPEPGVSRAQAAVTVVVGAAVMGALVGALWAWLAPPIHGVVALTRSGERITASLGSESDHWFTSAFMFVGMLGVVAVVGAVLSWQWRAHRGPVMAAALTVGGVAAAAVAAGVGASLARLRYGTVDVAGAPVSEESRVHYVVEAPAVFFGHSPLQIAATVLLPAAVAALVYLLAVTATVRDDLGAWPPVEYPLPTTGRIGTGADAPPAAPSAPWP